MDFQEETTTMTFRKEIATTLGIEEAIMFNHIAWWCQKNQERESAKHYHENTYWTYYSKRELAEFFGFWTESQVKRILKKLLDNDYLRKGNFNRKGYDKTCWYTPMTIMSTSLVEPAQAES